MELILVVAVLAALSAWVCLASVCYFLSLVEGTIGFALLIAVRGKVLSVVPNSRPIDVV